MNRNRSKDEFNNSNSFKDFDEFKKRKFYKDSNLNFKSFKENENVITRVFNNNITRSAYIYDDHNNNICRYYKKKDY